MINIEEIKVVGVVGAGTMGAGIAQLTALAGYQTLLFDQDEATSAKALDVIAANLEEGIKREKITTLEKEKALERISIVTELAEVKADLIIEAVVEKFEVKQQVFATLEKNNSKETILASNTSSIPITKLATQLKHRHRVVGLHFFNPAHIMKLVEVISGVETSEEIATVAQNFATRLNKVAVMANDSPGFIVNRVARNFYGEALKILEENAADIETVDSLMRASGFKMGPFQLMDLIGVDTNFNVTVSMFNDFYQDPKFRPSRLQQQKVNAGHTGRKSGKGFYSY